MNSPLKILYPNTLRVSKYLYGAVLALYYFD